GNLRFRTGFRERVRVHLEAMERAGIAAERTRRAPSAWATPRPARSAQPPALRWPDLSPEEEIAAALEHAGVRPDFGQDAKRHWSESFANRCAVAFATTLQRSPLSDKVIRPRSLAEGTEPLTPLGSGTSKRIDVTVV